MSERTVRFQYRAGIVTGGYSFSLHNNVIILSAYVEKLTDDMVREAIHFEAERARHHYVTEVNRLKTLGETVNTFIVKHEASQQARAEAQAKYPAVWDEVEITYKIYENRKPSPQPFTKARDDSEHETESCNPSKEIQFTVTVRDSDNIILDVTKESSSLKKLSDYL